MPIQLDASYLLDRTESLLQYNLTDLPDNAVCRIRGATS